MPAFVGRRRARELQRAEVTTLFQPVPVAPTFTDLTGGSVTVTASNKPLLVEAWSGYSPTNATAGNGGIMQLVRSDTGESLAEFSYLCSSANQSVGTVNLRRILSLPAGTTITFKLQGAKRVGGTASFGADALHPIVLRAVEVET